MTYIYTAPDGKSRKFVAPTLIEAHNWCRRQARELGHADYHVSTDKEING